MLGAKNCEENCDGKRVRDKVCLIPTLSRDFRDFPLDIECDDTQTSHQAKNRHTGYTAKIRQLSLCTRSLSVTLSKSTERTTNRLSREVAPEHELELELGGFHLALPVVKRNEWG